MKDHDEFAKEAASFFGSMIRRLWPLFVGVFLVNLAGVVAILFAVKHLFFTN